VKLGLAPDFNVGKNTPYRATIQGVFLVFFETVILAMKGGIRGKKRAGKLPPAKQITGAELSAQIGESGLLVRQRYTQRDRKKFEEIVKNLIQSESR
jgi:hypothetical protein